MKALFIGGTGTISLELTKYLSQLEWDITLLNRGNKNKEIPKNVKVITVDINEEEMVETHIENETFDVVIDFIAFRVTDLERDYRLFKGRTKQFIFISSASAYQKPLSNYIIEESTPLHNPYWQYSRDKIACEEFLMDKYRQEGFPITIVRPSHTYSNRSVPTAIHGDNGSWQVLKRMLDGKPVIIHGDGTSLWTLTHSSDFAKGMYGLMGNIHAIGQAIHITSDESVTWNQVYEIIANELNVPLKAVYVSSRLLSDSPRYHLEGGLLGDKANTVVFDNTKLKRFVPQYNAGIRADQGIRMTIQYILDHKECQMEDTEFDQWCDRVVEIMAEASDKMKELK